MASGALSGIPRKRRTRAQNSSTSSSAKMLPSDSIGTAWRTLANFSDGGAPTFRLSGFGVGELGKGRFERGVAAAQVVVFGVRDRRRVLAVIAPVVLGDLGAEPRVLGARHGEGLAGPGRLGHRREASAGRGGGSWSATALPVSATHQRFQCVGRQNMHFSKVPDRGLERLIKHIQTVENELPERPAGRGPARRPVRLNR